MTSSRIISSEQILEFSLNAILYFYKKNESLLEMKKNNALMPLFSQVFII